jgi:hypothetical protein
MRLVSEVRRRGSGLSLGRSPCARVSGPGVASLVVALALAGVSTAGSVGSGNPRGGWATSSAVRTIIFSHKLQVGECEPSPGAGFVRSSGNCKLGRPPTKPGVVAELITKVVSASVTGIGPYKLIAGRPRYQLFNVSACTVYFYRGAHRYGVHFRWFTGRPRGGTTTRLNRNGTTSIVRDSGAPYARDWNYTLFMPLAHGRC